MHRSKLGEESGIGRVGPVVDQQSSFAGHDRSIGTQAGCQFNDHSFTSTVRGQEFFSASEHKFHRAFCRLSQRCDVSLEVEATLAAETSTEMRDNNADLVRWEAKRLADACPRIKRNLGTRPDRDLGTLPLSEDRTGFDRGRMAGVGPRSGW